MMGADTMAATPKLLRGIRYGLDLSFSLYRNTTNAPNLKLYEANSRKVTNSNMLFKVKISAISKGAHDTAITDTIGMVLPFWV